MDEINCSNCMIMDFKESLCDNCEAMKRRGRAEELEKLIINMPRWIPCAEATCRSIARDTRGKENGMDDTISRQEAIDAVKTYLTDCQVEDADWHGDGIEHELNNLPSAQPERPRARWIRHPEQKNIYGGKCVECSECGEKYIVQYIEDEKYCRNCGAKMDAEEEE